MSFLAFCLDNLFQHAIRYWDWTLDADKEAFFKSPIFDPVDGFGGNGPFVPLPAGTSPGITPDRTGGGCVVDGPFVNMTVNLGPRGDLSGNPRCLSRDLSPIFASENSNFGVLDKVLKAANYDAMDRQMEGVWGEKPPSYPNIHGGGHYAVGGVLGVMGDFTVSVGGKCIGDILTGALLTSRQTRYSGSTTQI